jgi:hypothetical protein
MGRHKKSISRPFVMVFRDMLSSEAWEELTNASRVAYIHLKSKCVSKEQNEVTLSFKEMERFMDPKTYARALTQLIECGFITRAQRGGLFRKRNFFAFTDEWRNFKRPAATMKINSTVDFHHAPMGDMHHAGQDI